MERREGRSASKADLIAQINSDAFNSSSDEEDDDGQKKEKFLGGKVLVLVISGFFLVSFIVMKSSLALFLQAEKKLGDDEHLNGYPFVLQSVTLCAFALQVNFYTWQTTTELGLKAGFRALVFSYKDMGPAIFYSALVALSALFQQIAQSYIDASLYIILMQFALVVVALGDRFILKKVSTITLWLLVVLQAVIIIFYTEMARMRKTAEAEASPKTSAEQTGTGNDENPPQNAEDPMRMMIGIGLCLLAECCSACGSILQQRFMQVAAQDLSVSIKLWWQHLFAVIVLLATFPLFPSSIEKVRDEGFFVGWTHLTVATVVCMWLYYLAASSVTAYVSALAGSMAAAIVVLVIAFFDFFAYGETLGIAQILLMCALCCNTGLYTHLKDKHNQNMIEQQLLKKESRFGTAWSSASMRAQLELAMNYTPSDERVRLSSRRWNRSNTHLSQYIMEDNNIQVREDGLVRGSEPNLHLLCPLPGLEVVKSDPGLFAWRGA